MSEYTTAEQGTADAISDLEGNWVEFGGNEQSLRNHITMMIGPEQAYLDAYVSYVVAHHI